MPKYLVTGRVFGAGGKSLDGETVEKKGEISHPCFTKVTAQQAKKAEKGELEVATPGKKEK